MPQPVFSYDADVATDLRLLNTHDIVNLWADSTAEMKRRGIVRTRNVIGDLAETIAEAHLHGTRGSFSNKGWDLTTPDGERVQVKGLWRTSPTRTKLSAIRDSDYDWLMVIVFGPRFDLFGAFKAPRSFIEEAYPFVARIGGRQPTVTQRFMAHPDVQTMDISTAYRRIIATSAQPPAQPTS